MHIKENSIDDLLLSSLNIIKTHGQYESGTKGKYQELVGVLLELTNPLSRLSRTETKGTLFSCLGELFWYLSGSNFANHIKYYIPMYDNFKEADGSIGGAYGPRLISQNQFQNVVDLLKEKRSTRQAVIQLFDFKDLEKPRKKDIPCTLTLQFLVRDNKLDLCTSMRSNDSFVGLPHDIFCFTMIQEMIANTLDVELGVYKHFVGSLHAYENDLEKVDNLISEGLAPSSPLMPSMPPNPLSDLTTVLEIEKCIRLGQEIIVDIEKLPAYWQDIVTLLRLFKITKTQPIKNEAINEFYLISKKMKSNNYDAFIEKKLYSMKQKVIQL
jgi:thymidylate synthase